MKSKLVMVVVSSLLVIVLAACGDTQSETSSQSTDVDNAQTETEQTDVIVQQETPMDVERLLDKVVEAMKEVKSYTTEMELISETINSANENQVTQFNITGKSETITEPFITHNKMTLEGNGQGLNMEFETFIEGTTVYNFVPFFDSWEKYEMELQQTTDLTVSIEKLKDFAHLLELKETDDNFHLSVVGTGEEIENFLNEWAMEMIPDVQEDPYQSQSDVLESTSFELAFDKQTFRNKEMRLTMVAEEIIGDEPTQIRSEITVTNTGFNNVDSIEIPDEAKNASENGVPIIPDFEITDTEQPETNKLNPYENSPSVEQQQLQKQLEEGQN